MLSHLLSIFILYKLDYMVCSVLIKDSGHLQQNAYLSLIFKNENLWAFYFIFLYSSLC